MRTHFPCTRSRSERKKAFRGVRGKVGRLFVTLWALRVLFGPTKGDGQRGERGAVFENERWGGGLDQASRPSHSQAGKK